jgi:hypothetical protein
MAPMAVTFNDWFTNFLLLIGFISFRFVIVSLAKTMPLIGHQVKLPKNN